MSDHQQQQEYQEMQTSKQDIRGKPEGNEEAHHDPAPLVAQENHQDENKNSSSSSPNEGTSGLVDKCVKCVANGAAAGTKYAVKLAVYNFKVNAAISNYVVSGAAACLGYAMNGAATIANYAIDGVAACLDCPAGRVAKGFAASVFKYMLWQPQRAK